MMSFLAYTFAKEIRNFSIYIKTANIYVLPILEFGSVIWYQENITREAKLKKIYKYATRYAIPDENRYLNYDNRLRNLHMPSLRKRRMLNAIIIIDKIMKQELITKLQDR